MSVVFNPPPGWPPQPQGWRPPPGWQPDPAWPAPPAGWPLWLEAKDPPKQAISLGTFGVSSRIAMIGGLAVFLGSLLPFISSSDGTATIHSNARVASAIFGLLLAGLGAGLQLSPASVEPDRRRRRLKGIAITLLIVAGLGTLGYIIFTAVGFSGVTQDDGFGLSQKVTFSPSIGLILSILGCLAAVYGAIRALRSDYKA
jgi:hypothetical protein